MKEKFLILLMMKFLLNGFLKLRAFISFNKKLIIINILECISMEFK